MAISDTIKQGMIRAPHRSLLRATGVGATRGACIGHLSPEAAAGGPIAFVEEGDTIRIDIPHRRLELDVPDEVLAKRKAKWKPHPPKIDYGYLARYAAQVTSADTGAVFKKPEL